ncbi:hypothetical protein CK203_074046 [Vitis vinifera]|uniref:Retrotransposon gag domain-containing protein n=1 Tax=Vitis vinifera TaxID=29760 RepID=A0A438E7W7_VITVI|nr:hypothetical protein CK203_074046 [Vitis vinifera]
MDSQIVTVDQFAEAMASIQEAIASLGRRIDGQQASSQSAPQAMPFTLHSQTEVAPPPFTVPTPTSEDPHARMDRLEQGVEAVYWHWLSTPPSPIIQHRDEGSWTGRASDDYSFPLSLSGAAQRWFASLEASRRRTWDDLAQEFLRQFSFNTVVDVSRRELEALRQRAEESVSSFISRWRGKIAEIIDRPSERTRFRWF